MKKTGIWYLNLFKRLQEKNFQKSGLLYSKTFSYKFVISITFFKKKTNLSLGFYFTHRFLSKFGLWKCQWSCKIASRTCSFRYSNKRTNETCCNFMITFPFLYCPIEKKGLIQLQIWLNFSNTMSSPIHTDDGGLRLRMGIGGLRKLPIWILDPTQEIF